MRAVGYTRVSTEEQKKLGISLEMQREKIEIHAAEQGWELIDVLEDGGYSGKNTRRPGFQKLIKMISAKETDVIIVYKFDRLNRKEPDAMDFRRRLDITGIDLCSITQAKTLNDGGKFLYGIYASLAEKESDDLSERTGHALEHKKSLGLRTGYLEYGMTVAEDGKTKIPEPYEQKVIKWVKKWMSQGAGSYEITQTLNMMGFKNRKGRELELYPPEEPPPKRVGRFTPQAIDRLCKKIEEGKI